MVSKSNIERPDSYAVTDFSARHLEILEYNFSKFLGVMQRSIDNAHNLIYGTYYSEYEVNKRGLGEQYYSPIELKSWLDKKLDKISALKDKIESSETSIISGVDLQNLREIRAFFIRFKSIANDVYGGAYNVSFNDRQISTLLNHDISIESENGGIFDLLINILKNEKSSSSKDLISINPNMNFGKTLKAIVIQRHREGKALLNQEIPAPDIHLRDTIIPSNPPEAIATQRNPQTHKQATFSFMK